MTDVEAFVALQPDEVGLEARRERFGDFGLADPGLSLQEKWALQLEREVNGSGEASIRDVELAREQAFELLDRRDSCGQQITSRDRLPRSALF